MAPDWPSVSASPAHFLLVPEVQKLPVVTRPRHLQLSPWVPYSVLLCQLPCERVHTHFQCVQSLLAAARARARPKQETPTDTCLSIRTGTDHTDGAVSRVAGDRAWSSQFKPDRPAAGAAAAMPEAMLVLMLLAPAAAGRDS